MRPSFFYAIINKMKILMNKGKLKVLVMALKEVVEELESEIYSDVDAYKVKASDYARTAMPSYDEVFEDDEGL